MTGAGEKAYCAGGDIRGIYYPLLVLDLGLLGMCDLGNNKCVFSVGGVDYSRLCCKWKCMLLSNRSTFSLINMESLEECLALSFVFDENVRFTIQGHSFAGLQY